MKSYRTGPPTEVVTEKAIKNSGNSSTPPGKEELKDEAVRRTNRTWSRIGRIRSTEKIAYTK